MDINAWLQQFRNGWIEQDVDRVISLFSEDVEYWETPFKQILSSDKLQDEWQGIKNQKDIRINTHVYSSSGNKHSVRWDLRYMNPAEEIKEWAGVYLIELNNDGVCQFFYQSGETI